MEKVIWSGRVISVQPRIRLTRSFDERGHDYLGYSLTVDGVAGDEVGQFSVGVGKVAHSKHRFRVGDEASGEARPVADERTQPVDFYRASKLRVMERSQEEPGSPPPWHGVPPDLETYRWRGHRRLSARTYRAGCITCIWGCRMPVTMIIDPWNPRYRYRFETFCYGPKSCPIYKPGPSRRVPGRRGMVYEEQDWVDEDATAHREWNE
jgi:hypothetical protein